MVINKKLGLTFILVFIYLFVDKSIVKVQSQGILVRDSLPAVFDDKTDALHALYRHKAINFSKKHQVPANSKEWDQRRTILREQILAGSGIKFYKDLPLNLKETGRIEGEGFTVRNVYFQTRPGVYATANLYVPNGNGSFPAVVVMMGHSSNGKLYTNYQSVGQSLAKDGYVALAIDPWGAGERSTVHGEFEYHGSVLGASLYNLGESLLGMQVTDNMRAVDLLVSLPFVNKEKIGATGASGGGNQTMWLAAIDERIKAAMPVVSVGTFESYIMGHNCVCEVLPSGLSAMEEWEVLGLVAPRAIKMCNHNQELNQAFLPSEMLKSYNKAQRIFEMMGVRDNITYQFVDRPHGYFPENREALLGWLDFHLKESGNGEPKKEKPITVIEEEKLMVFPKGQRPNEVHSTESYAKWQGELLRKKSETSSGSVETKRNELEKILKLNQGHKKSDHFKIGDVGEWERWMMETSDGKLLPVLKQKGSRKDYAIVAHSQGKWSIPVETINHISKTKTVVIIDFSGSGEASSENSKNYDKLARSHTYGRASLWLGETMTGNWVNELKSLKDWLVKDNSANSIVFHGYKEAGFAGLFLAATGEKFNQIYTYETPTSFVFDTRKNVEYVGVGGYIPGILQWGDFSTVAALGNTDIIYKDPVTISGNKLSGTQQSEMTKLFELMKKKFRSTGKISFE